MNAPFIVVEWAIVKCFDSEVYLSNIMGIDDLTISFYKFKITLNTRYMYSK